MNKFYSFVAMLLISSGLMAAEKSPFNDVLYDSLPSVVVTVNGTNYYLLSIDGIRRAEIISKCEAKYGSSCQCMFAEKFSTTMKELGYSIGETASLSLYFLETHEVLNVDNPISESNNEEILINRSLRNELCY